MNDIVGTRCPIDGKVRFGSRRSARRWVRRHHGKHSRLRPYKCGAFFHLGHLADPVRHGDATRHDIYAQEHTA